MLRRKRVSFCKAAPSYPVPWISSQEGTIPATEDEKNGDVSPYHTWPIVIMLARGGSTGESTPWMVEKNSSSATAVYAQHWYSEGVR